MGANLRNRFVTPLYAGGGAAGEGDGEGFTPDAEEAGLEGLGVVKPTARECGAGEAPELDE